MTDARERLRAYLEQRRELGERELVLDGMTVEEVLRLVGVTTAGAPALQSRAARAFRRLNHASLVSNLGPGCGLPFGR